MAQAATDRGALRSVTTHEADDLPRPGARKGPYLYRAFGLGISSDFEIPELTSSSGALVEVRIVLGTAGNGFDARGDDFAEVTPTQAFFGWKGVGLFRVTGGTEIYIWPDPDVEEAVIRLALLGVVFGALLTQRSLHVLHASAVVIDDAAVCFAANKGGGKSTIATALMMRGHRVIADDAGVVTFNENGVPLLLPGFPRLNVWPYAADALGLESRDIPPLHSNGVKRGLSVADRFLPSPDRLKRIYLLDRGEALALEVLGDLDAFFALVPHWYRARYMSGDTSTPGILLDVCSRLIKCVSVRRLTVTDPVCDAQQAAQLVENDVRASDSKHSQI